MAGAPRERMEVIRTSTRKDQYLVKYGDYDRWWIEVEQTDGFLNSVEIYDEVRRVTLSRAWVRSLLEVVRNYEL
jgi:hypothetical protein